MPDSPTVTVLDAAFVAEARDVSQMPGDGLPEIAIAGRSNVGKSTLLNRMAGRHGLARVSKTPGRTRGLVVFDLRLRLAAEPEPKRMRLVDLPGYGYAKVAQDQRRAWQGMVEGYLKDRPTLALVLVLVDARRGLADEDLQLLQWLRGGRVPCFLAVTKSDKLGAAERGLVQKRVRKDAAGAASSVFVVSGATGEGMGELWRSVAHVLNTRKGDGAPESG
jgi:GTP-binding protein